MDAIRMTTGKIATNTALKHRKSAGSEVALKALVLNQRCLIVGNLAGGIYIYDVREHYLKAVKVHFSNSMEHASPDSSTSLLLVEGLWKLPRLLHQYCISILTPTC